MPRFNRFEYENRELKKDAIIRFIYAHYFRPDTVKARARMAQILKSCTVTERNWFAYKAGTNPPTDETWRQIVEEIRGR